MSRSGQSNKGFDPARFATPKMPVDTVIRLKEVFDAFDYDGSGNLSTEELVNTIRALGLQKQGAQILKVVERSGINGEMDFAGFLSVFGASDSQSESSLQQIFEEFDKTGHGGFGAAEFEKVAASVGEQFSSAEIQEMIDFAGKDGNGEISFERFSALMTKHYPKV